MNRFLIALILAGTTIVGCGDGEDGSAATSVASSITGDGGGTATTLDAVPAGGASPPAAVELPQGGAIDALDQVEALGPDCASGAIGLGVTTPEGWECRVLAKPEAGIDGFTLLTEGSDLNITVATPSPLGPPCELLGICDGAEPIELSGNFPNTAAVTFTGAVTIWGAHHSVAAEVVVTKTSALTPDESSVVASVLDSAVEL